MQEIEKVKITTEFIKLDQCLKWLAVVGSGSEAKEIIINEEVKGNGEIEVRRGRKIYPGYKIKVFDRVFEIE